MKILILAKKFPYPLREGEPIAVTYLSRSLVQLGCEVSLLVMNTTKHYFDPAKLPESYNHFQEIHSVTVDNRITIPGALKSLFTGTSYILSRFFSTEYAEKLAELLRFNQFDVVQLETLYMAHYIPVIRKHSQAVIALRSHNVEHEIWQRVAANSKAVHKKWYLKNQIGSLKSFETNRIAACDILLAITERDLAVFRKLGYRGEAVVAPVGIDISEYDPAHPAFMNEHSVAFIGALDWMPNQEGVVWFIEKVWPFIVKKFPEAEFHVAGKNTPDWLRRKRQQGVVFHGEVPDAKAFIKKHPVLVAPLFSGSGIKIKILEGMALSRVVITTEVGSEGIMARRDEELLVANTPDQFIEKIRYCFENQNVIMDVGQSARQFIIREFDNLEIADQVTRAYHKRIEAR